VSSYLTLTSGQFGDILKEMSIDIDKIILILDGRFFKGSIWGGTWCCTDAQGKC